MGKRYIAGVVEVELVDGAGDGYMVEVGGKYTYDKDVLEVDYVYNLETASYIDKAILSDKDKNDVVNYLTRSGTYFTGDDGDSAYELNADK